MPSSETRRAPGARIERPAPERASAALVLRSALFNVAFYVNMIGWMLYCHLLLPFPRRVLMRAVQAWARSSLVLLRVIAGTRAEFRGLERVPRGGALLAAKHQSLWETFALLTIVDDPAFVLKRELTFVPLFGWLALKAGMISVDRRGGRAAVASMTRQARAAVEAGRQVIIFPEGTRRAPGAPPDYKIGVALLYGSLGVPCLPVALNSGLFWPRRRFLRRPGTVVVEVLPPLPPGLDKTAFMEALEGQTEHASTELLREAGAMPEGGKLDGPA